MLYKARTVPSELQILRSLSTRMQLADKEKQHYYNLKKGYEGEKMFDVLTEKLQCECLILNDLLLKKNNTIFQIDSSIVISDTIYIFEVKNYEGDYYYESDRIYKKSKSEITNPLNQLGRTESLLRQLLKSLGFNILVSSFVVFINPEFTLYQSPLNKPFIFPTQLNRLLKQIETTSSTLNDKHRNLANKLLSLHIDDSPFNQLPAYDYDQLRKGITCDKCTSFSISVEGTKCVCKECEHEETVTNAVLRSVKEFQLLFPNRKITTAGIHDWCKVVPYKKRIKRILEKNFKIIGTKRWTYYEIAD